MNREEWLNELSHRMSPMFQEHGHELPDKFRVSVGFTSKGLGKAIGQCWSDECSGDKHHEIFIDPRLADPMRVAGVLAHELIHAIVGLEHGHKRPFGKLARAIGLEGKMTATIEGAAFKSAVQPMLDAMCALPHAALNGESSGKKKQTTRMVKCQCDECGYTVRTTQKWIDVAAPVCPVDGSQMSHDGATGDGGDEE